MIGTATNRDLILSIKNTRCCLLDGYFGSRLFRTFLSCGGDGMLAAVPKPKRLKDAVLIKETRSDRCKICRGRAECEVHHGLFFRS